VGEIPLYFYVPMKRFFDETDQDDSKTQGGKGQIRKIQKKGKEWRKEKEEIFTDVEVPILVCSPSARNALVLPPSCNLPLGELTRMGTSPYN
jgi:hypothetical protein